MGDGQGKKGGGGEAEDWEPLYFYRLLAILHHKNIKKVSLKSVPYFDSYPGRIEALPPPPWGSRAKQIEKVGGHKTRQATFLSRDEATL